MMKRPWLWSARRFSPSTRSMTSRLHSTSRSSPDQPDCPGVFYVHDGDNITMLAIHIDNCLITGASYKLVTDYRQSLDITFALTAYTCYSESKSCVIAKLAPYPPHRHPVPFSNASRYPTKPCATPIIPGANYTIMQAPADATEAAYMHAKDPLPRGHRRPHIRCSRHPP